MTYVVYCRYCPKVWDEEETLEEARARVVDHYAAMHPREPQPSYEPGPRLEASVKQIPFESLTRDLVEQLSLWPSEVAA